MTAIVRRTHSSSLQTLYASLRLALLGSSALVGSATLAGQASAQSLPVPTNAAEPGVTFSGPGGGAPNDRMDVDLGGTSRIIDFNSYNIGAGNTAHYSTSVAATDLVAVNRVVTTGGGPSMIDGTLQADAGISVWLINQEGISYNGNTTLNGGSLVLSTLDFADAGAVPGDVPLQFAGTSTSGITIGGNLNVAGSIVAIGQQITTNSALTAGNGSVVLVAASDVTFTNGLGNPLSFTVNAGTTLASGSASPVNVNGNLTGNSVVVAGGMQNSLTAALLNISSTATLTATAVNGTVTIATTSTGGGIGIVNDSEVTPGIVLDGNLASTGAGGNVVVASGGDLTGNGMITALNDASVSALGDIVSTTGSYTATGGTLTIAAGGDATLGALTGGTDIAVSTDGSATLGGAVSAGGMLNLISLVDATVNGDVTTGGDVSLVVRRDTTIAGDIDAGGTYSLETGRDLGQSGDVRAAGDVLADVGGNASVTGLHASGGGLVSIGVTGDATLGALTAATDVNMTTGGFATVNGAVNAGNDFLVLSGTDTTLAGTVTARDVSLSSGRDTFVTGSVNAARDFLVTDTLNYTQSGTVVAGRNVDLTIDAIALATGSIRATTGFVDIGAGSATFGAITAGTDVTLTTSGFATVNGAVNAGTDFLVLSGTDTTLAGAVTARDVSLSSGRDTFVTGGVNAARDFLVTDTLNYTQSGTVVAGRNVDLTIDAIAFATGSIRATTGFVDIGADSATFGAITAGTDITASITNSADFTGALSAGGDVGLTAGTDLFVRGDVSAGRAYRATANAVTLGTTGVATAQTAGDGVLIHALGGNIVGLGSLVLSSDASAVGVPALTNLELRADLGEVRFGIDTGLVAGIAGGRTDVILTSAPNIALGDVTANRLLTAGETGLLTSGSIATDDLAIGSGISLTSTTAGVATGALTTGGAVSIVATGDITVNAGAAPTDASVLAGSTITLLTSGGRVTADGALAAGGTVSVSATGDITLNAGAPLTQTSVQAGATINLFSSGGSILSGGRLTTTAGDIIVNALHNVSLDEVSTTAVAAPGAIVLRVGDDIQLRGSLTSASDDIFIHANGNATLQTVTAADDIDITVGGTLNWTALQIAGGADTARFADLSGAAGTAAGVNLAAPADAQLAGGHVVRVRAGNVGAAAAGPVGLIAGNVSSGTFSATALNGDIRIGEVTSTGNIDVTATEGAITGLPRTGLPPVAGGTINGIGAGAVDTVLLNITGSGAIDSIRAGTVLTNGTTDVTTLRIGTIVANTVNLRADQTLHVANVTAAGDVDLVTTGGSALAMPSEIMAPDLRLAPDFLDADLTATGADATVSITALGGVTRRSGIAQLGTVRAGSAAGLGGIDQIVVSARALTIAQAEAFDGSLVVTATDGLLSLALGSARQHARLLKRNDDGTSVGSGTTTDILAIGDFAARTGGVTAGFDVDIRSATSILANDVIATGNSLADRHVLMTAARDIRLNLARASRGSIGILAGGEVFGGSLTAFDDIGIQGGTANATPRTGVTIDTATAGDDIDIIALNGDLTLTNATSTGSGARNATVTFGTPGAAGSIVFTDPETGQLTGSTIRLRSAAGSVTSATTPTIAGWLRTQGTGDILVNASQAATLERVDVAGGSIGVLAGGQVTAGQLTASHDIGIQGGTSAALSRTNVTVGTAIAGDDIDILALNGDIALTNATSTGSGTGSGTSTSYGTPGVADAVAVTVGPEPAPLAGSTIRLHATSGNISSQASAPATAMLRTQGVGDILINASGRVTLSNADAVDGSIGVLAGGQVTGTLLTASRDIAVQGGTDVTIGSSTAGDDIDIVALNGNLTVTNATSTGSSPGGSSISFGTAGTLNAVAVTTGPENAQLAGSTIRLRSQTGSVTSTGALLTQGTGDVLVNARGDATLATTTASRGSVALLAGGNLTAATTTASEDVTARAGGNASLTSTTAGDDIEVAAGGRVTLGTATIGGSPTGLDARQATLGVVQAGLESGIAFTTGDPRGRNIKIEATDVDLQGLLEATAGTITLRNTGANATLIGDGTITTGTNFGVSNTELGRLRSNSLVIDSGSRTLELGTFTIDATTGRTDTRFLATGTVEITGAITVAGTAERTLQIGGLLGDLGDDAAAVPLATSLIARIDRASAPRIDAGSANVELRAEKILFGTGAMVDEYIGKSGDEIARIVSDPTSKLYYDAAAQPIDVFLTARTVTVGYKNFALFQNTDINRSAGVLVNSPVAGLPQQTALALRLVSTGEDGNNSFAMFGVVNNFFGTSAALLTNDAIQIVNPTGDLNDFRITRASSRINGCVIGAPDRGCLATDIPQPNFNLYDERKIALFDVDDDQTIAVSPLIGRGNDGLIVNVADAPVGIDTIECRPEDPNCPAKEGN